MTELEIKKPNMMMDFNLLEDVVSIPKDSELTHMPLDDFVDSNWLPDTLIDLWCENYDRNKPHLKPFAIRRQNDNVAVLVGASPAIEKNYTGLYEIVDDPRFTIIASNSILKFLLKKNIKPDYVFCVEGKHHIATDFDDCETEDLTLIISPFVCPEVVEKWKGKLYTYFQGASAGKFGERLVKDWEGKANIDIGGGNVVSTSYLWAYRYLNIRHFILMGMSLCYYGDYYADGRKGAVTGLEQYRDWYKAMDINGDMVCTTPVLTMYKLWLETYTRHGIEYGGGSFINSTEDGILGIYPEIVEQDGLKVRFKRTFVPWMSVVPLEIAIQGHLLRMNGGEH